MRTVKDVAKSVYLPVRPLLHQIRDVVLAPESIYRTFLRLRHGASFTRQAPLRFSERGGALRTHAQWREAAGILQRAGLPVHQDGPKNWDTLIAISEVLSATAPDAAVMDAGAEVYSALLPALYTCGYRRLTGVNLVFNRVVTRGPIRYEPGDITATRFGDGSFDAVTCLSVVEHGVDLDRFFAEMARLLRAGGVLVVSTDYWETPVETHGRMAYGAPIRIFTRDDIEKTIALAARHGLELVSPVDLGCTDRVVRWAEFDLEYTFVALSFRRA